MAEQNSAENNASIPEHWHQLDHDEGDEHIYVHKTDSDPHYYDKSVEIVINEDAKAKGAAWEVYARTGRDREAKQVFFSSYSSKEEAQKKIQELMEKGF